MKFLVVGGAGYIGSHMVKHLAKTGCRVTTLDNLVSGHRDAVLHGDFVLGDIADKPLLQRLFATTQFDAVMHFASFIQVGESVQKPAMYYENNVTNTLNLLDTMRLSGVDKFIFSSTAERKLAILVCSSRDGKCNFIFFILMLLHSSSLQNMKVLEFQ